MFFEFRHSGAMRLSPKKSQLIGEELAVQWNDGKESYFPLEGPCDAPALAPLAAANQTCLATSRGPHVSYTEAALSFWAGSSSEGCIQPRWRDGHSTVLYSFQYLLRLAAAPS